MSEKDRGKEDKNFLTKLTKGAEKGTEFIKGGMDFIKNNITPNHNHKEEKSKNVPQQREYENSSSSSFVRGQIRETVSSYSKDISLDPAKNNKINSSECKAQVKAEITLDSGEKASDNLRCKAYFARQIGRSHLSSGNPCQDFCLVKELNDAVFVSAVADGHGSEECPFSEDGSRLACKAVVDVTRDFYAKVAGSYSEQGFVAELNSEAFRDAVLYQWDNLVCADYGKKQLKGQLPAKEIRKKYGTTLLYTIVTEHYYVLGQLGDGVILLFNTEEAAQLFKRHGQKYDSVTSSLSSSNRTMSFVQGVVARETFSQVLLSTDGIYDKLDGGDSFVLYGRSLVQQLEKEGKLTKPFTLCLEGREPIDVSAKSKDDCTIVLLKSDIPAMELPRMELERAGYTEISFKRAFATSMILEAQRNGITYTIHVNDCEPLAIANDFPSQIKRAQECLPLENGKFAVCYKQMEKLVEIAELYETGELREKKYQPRNYVLEGEIPEKYDNVIILKIYEKLKELQQELNRYNLESNLGMFATVSIDSKGKAYCYSDCLRLKQSGSIDVTFPKILRQFNLLGKISCGKYEQPLFKTYSDGRKMYYLHTANEELPMLCVKYVEKSKSYVAVNISPLIWEMIVNEKVSEIGAKKGFYLSSDRSFSVKCSNDVVKYAAIENGIATYTITLFKE